MMGNTDGHVGTSAIGHELRGEVGVPGCCAAAVCADRGRIATRTNSEVTRRVFGICLQLQATAQTADDAARGRLEFAADALDAAIIELRRAIYDRADRPTAALAQVGR